MDFKTLAVESQKHIGKLVGDDYVLVNGKYQLRSELERVEALQEEESKRLNGALERLRQVRKDLSV